MQRTKLLSIVIFGALVCGLMLREAAAESKVPVRTAVKTTIGPSDAPVRTAEFNSADQSNVSVQPVWRGRYYGYYAPYTTYYSPGPYYYPGPAYYGPTYVAPPPRRVYYYPAPMYVPYGAYYY